MDGANQLSIAKNPGGINQSVSAAVWPIMETEVTNIKSAVHNERAEGDQAVSRFDRQNLNLVDFPSHRQILHFSDDDKESGGRNRFTKKDSFSEKDYLKNGSLEDSANCGRTRKDMLCIGILTGKMIC